MKLGGAVNRGLGLLGLQTVGAAVEETATRGDGEGIATRAGVGEVGFELVNVAGGGRLSRRQVEGIAAAFACVDVISTAIAALPAVIERVGPEGREVVTDHPLARMFVRPNLWQTWPDFIQWLVAEALWDGNGLAVLRPGGMIEPARWSGVQPIARNGAPAFWVQREAWPGDLVARTGARRLHSGSQVVHLSDRSDDGRIGVARRARATGSVELAYQMMRASQAAYRNALMPSGALSFQRRLTGEQKAALRGQIREEMAGEEHAGMFMLLDEGATWQPITITPRDGDLLGARQQSVPEICRVFEVPPPLVQDYTYNTFTNSTQAGVWFAQFTLAGWVAKIEAELSEKILGDGYRLRLDMSALMRGDTGERWDAYDKALRHGVLEPEQVARMEGWR